MVTIVSNTSDCNDGDIRLVGGASKYEGTIEICFGNLWGLIAETGWGDHDAQVVCRQLGYISDGLLFIKIIIQSFCCYFY